MQISHLFFTFLAIFIIGVLIVLFNTRSILAKMDINKGSISIHLFAIVLIVIGKIGAIVTGIIWAITYLKH